MRSCGGYAPASPWTAFACGSAYLFAPSILLRLGHVEHVGNVLAFALLPLAFRSVLVFSERRMAGRRCCARPAMR